MVQPVPQPDLLRPTLSAAIDVAHRLPRQEERQPDVLDDSQRRKKVEELKHEADPLAPQPSQGVVVERAEQAFLEPDFPTGGSVHRAGDVEQRRLPAPRRPHHRGKGTRIERQAHAVDRRDVAVAALVSLRDVAHLEHGHVITIHEREATRGRFGRG